ncbi:MAG TPA: L-seryl-tRNA(Sec) selenium transferase [Polyangiaceae bacterium]
MTPPHDEALRTLPRVDRVAAHPALDEARRALGAAAVTELVRAAIAEARQAVLAGGASPGAEEVAARVAARARARLGQRVRRVINATGVVLHTNLGRAPLSADAAEAVALSARGYASLEIDLASGGRGGRGAFAEHALAQLTGAEAALVVNNNAAAVLLALASVAGGKGVLVSRGELVEIGGGFRIPEVLARSGARMIEVGTTNKTHDRDYASALEAERDVAAILRVHPGNFRQTGFVERPSLEAVVGLAHAARDAGGAGVTVIEDLGGGLLVDPGVPGLEREPLVRASVAAGADLVCFSTDKALGGPQGGAVVGRAALVERLRRDPLARALRLGRLPLVALEATLAHLLRGELDAVPALAALRAPLAEVRARAERWAAALRTRGVAAGVVALEAVAGGGAFAEEGLASAGVALIGQFGEGSRDAEALLARLRRGERALPVIARVGEGHVVLDARTVLPGEDDELLRAIVDAVAGAGA